MKYAILIHSNPQPWAHPTSEHTADYQALPAEEQDRLGAHFDEVFGEAERRGEIVAAWAFGDPALARILRYDGGADGGVGAAVESPGPYSSADEHVAGIVIVEVASEARAVEIAEAFCCPGDAIEVRPIQG